jgi:hypothetical protein
MTFASRVTMSTRMEEAVAELKELIRGRYPEAIFDIGQGEDPEGIYLTAMVDVDDRGEVIDLFLDRLVELQVEEGLPLFIAPVRTPERTAAIRAHDSVNRALLVI